MDTASIILVRKRILSLFANAAKKPLTIVTAPMGYGKTTAAKQYVTEMKLSYIWISGTISSKQDDFFWQLLCSQISEISPELGIRFEGLGFPNSRTSISRVMEAIYQTRLNTDITLVIDDYQFIETPAKNVIIRLLAEQMIPNFHMIILTRNSPLLATVEMELKNCCITISSSELAFTIEECHDYFNLLNISSSHQQLFDIYNFSNGWIPAIYLFCKELKKHPHLKVSMTDSISDLIQRSIYDSHSASDKKMMVMLSLLETFTFDLIDFVFDDPIMTRRIKELIKDNLFVSELSSGLYSFHGIFLDFLRSKKTDFEIDNKKILTRAGLYYLNRKEFQPAFDYYKQILYFDELLDRMDSDPSFFIHPINRKPVFDMFSIISDELKYRYPLATLKYICYFALSDNTNKARKLLDQFTEYFKMNSHPFYSHERLEAECYVAEINVYYNDLEKMTASASKALKLLDGAPSSFKSSDDYFTLGSPHMTYLFYRYSGEYSKIVDIFNSNFSDIVLVTNGLGAGADFLALAESSLEQGYYEKAASMAKKAMLKASMAGQHTLSLCAAFTLSRAYIVLNHIEDAIKQIENKDDNQESRINTMDLCCGYIYACLGNSHSIPEWLISEDQYVERLTFRCMCFTYIVYEKAVTASKDYITLEVLTDILEAQFLKYPNNLGLIHNSIHRAIAFLHLYGKESAATELQKALNLALPDKIILPFIENALELYDLFSSFTFSGDEELITRIIHDSGIYLANINNYKKEKPLLSERERTILHLAEEGKSQKEIADILYISKNTVNRHMSNIFEKLQVNNKMSAIKKAKELL